MPIEISCSNIVRWDEQSKKYVACGHRVAASEAMAGTFIECPKCGCQLEVPQVDASSSLALLPADEPFPTASASPSATTDDAGQRDAYTISSEDGSWELSDSQPKSPAHTPTTLQVGRYCAGCGAPMNAGDKMCSACGYHVDLGRQITTTVRGPSKKGAGAKRWLEGALAEGESAKGVLLLAAILAFLIFFAFSVLLLNGIGAGALLFIVPVLLLFGLIAAGMVTGYRSRARLAEGEPPKNQNFGWHFMLVVIRMFQWREPRWPFRKREVLKVTDTEFGDDDLINLDGINECSVLDLQGTQVSDKGMPYLTGLPELRFVVVKKTKVTGAGAQFLQHASPEMWIWF